MSKTSIIDGSHVESSSGRLASEVFNSELLLINVIRGLIENSSKHRGREKEIVEQRKVQIDKIITNLRPRNESGKKLTGKKHIDAVISMCENYYIVLMASLDRHSGDYGKTLTDMCVIWDCVKSDKGFIGVKVNEALYLIYHYMFKECLRFGKFHAQATAHLALIEHRMRNGLFLGKYKEQWNVRQTDAEVIYKYALDQGVLLSAQMYRLEVNRLHNETTGSGLVCM